MMQEGRIRLWRRLLMPVGLLLGISLGISLRTLHMGDVRVHSPDEHVYVSYAGQIALGGPGATATLFREYAANPANTNFPSPIRVGHTFLLAGTMAMADFAGFGPAVLLSFTCSVLSLALVAWAGLRFFGPLTALAGVLFLSSSVVELSLARRAWQDAVFGFFAFLTVYFAMEILRSPRRLWPFAGLFLAGPASVLMKHSGLIVYLVCVLGVIIFTLVRRWPVGQSLLVAGLSMLALLGAGLLVVYLAGGWDLAWKIARLSVVFAPEAVRWTTYCCSGPWWQVPWALFRLNPLEMAFAALGIVSLLRRPSRYAILAAAVTLSIIAFISFTPLLESLRFCSPVNGTLALLAGTGVASLVRAVPRYRRPASAILVLALLISAAADFRHFERTSVRLDLQDLGVNQVFEALLD